ncbi:MAG: hypothetical protein ACK4NQ_00560 [Fimbriimonadaceae bacterium]
MLNLVLLTVLAPAQTAPVWVRVEGDGYLRFIRDGRVLYAREAPLVVRDGELRHADGPGFLPRLSLSSSDFTIATDGTVRVQGQVAGRILLARLQESDTQVQGGFFTSSIRPSMSPPATDGMGRILTGDPLSVQSSPVTTGVAGAVPQWSLKSEALVTGDRITLGDLVDGAGDFADIDLGAAPPFGVKRTFDRAFLLARLRTASPGAQVQWMGAERVSVTRAGQLVEPDMLLNAARLAARNARGHENFELDGKLDPLAIAPGAAEIRSERVNANGAKVSVALGIYVEGVRVAAVTVPLRDNSPAVTMRTGQTVTIVVIRGALRVETTGTVRRVDSATGMVVVKTASGAELNGRATSADTVEVTS